MKNIYIILVLLGFIGAAFAGGLAAVWFMPEPVQAESLQSFAPPVKTTVLNIPNKSLSSFNGDYTKVGDIGVFTVESSSSLIEVTHQGRLYVADFNTTSPSGAIFQLRIDGVEPIPYSGMSIIKIEEKTQYVPSTFSGIWQGLSAGNHTVSLYVKTFGTDVAGINAIMNPGGFLSNVVIIKETLPFGATYLPSILNQ